MNTKHSNQHDADPTTERGKGLATTTGSACGGVELFSPLEFGIVGQPLMVGAHHYNRLYGAIEEALMHLETNVDIDGQSMAESDAAEILRNSIQQNS